MGLNSEIVLYDSPDGELRIQVKLEDETVWLTQEQMATLFNKARSTITEHIANIFKEGELEKKVVCRNFRLTTQHGAMKGKIQEKEVAHYNLDVIISVGYRVRSLQGTKFRQWATQRIKEYIVKGFTIDDTRLKQEGGRSRYFDELLQRIRDIRASERNFYQKITDIYATAIDYRKDTHLTKEFFATVQNEVHYAVHGRTAAELIHHRADSHKPRMGLTSLKGEYLTKKDTTIAKNYLSKAELKQLNLIVTLYLDFAELQATNGRLMKMQDWISKLDDFLKLSEKEILQGAGAVSRKQALEKATKEFQHYKHIEDTKRVSDFDRATKRIVENKKRWD